MQWGLFIPERSRSLPLFLPLWRFAEITLGPLCTNAQKAEVLADFLSWNGGDYPENQREICICDDCSLPMAYDVQDVVDCLSELITSDPKP
jgi:hypothetical protein